MHCNRKNHMNNIVCMFLVAHAAVDTSSTNIKAIKIGTTVPMSIEYINFIYVTTITAKMQCFISVNENILVEMNKSTIDDKFAILCNVFISMTSANDCSEEEKAYWKVLHECFYSKTSRKWNEFETYFSSFYSQRQLSTSSFDNLDLPTTLFVFCTTYASHLNKITKEAILDYLIEKEIETYVFSITAEDVERIEDNVVRKTLMVVIEPCNNYEDMQFYNKFARQKKSISVCDMKSVLAKELPDFDAIEILTEHNQQFLNFVNDNLHKEYAVRVNITISEIYTIIYKSAQCYISRSFAGVENLQKHKITDKDMLKFDKKKIYYHSSTCEFELGVFREAVERFRHPKDNSKQIELFCRGILKLITFLSLFGIYDSISIEESNFRNFVKSARELSINAFMVLVSVVNESHDFIGDFEIFLTVFKYRLELENKRLDRFKNLLQQKGARKPPKKKPSHLVSISNRNSYIF